MRFNDLMQTVLAAEERTGPGAVTLWRQCVDLLAQNDRSDLPPLAASDRDALLERLETLRTRVTETQRIATVVELGSRLRSPALVRFFADDRAAICAAAMARARLPDHIWPELLSHLGPTARGVLRNRGDLGPETLRALNSFGQFDLVLTDGPEADGMRQGEPAAEAFVPSESQPEDQIRRLVDRIERFTSAPRARSEEPRRAPILEEAPKGLLRHFGFETDAYGMIAWIDDGPRAALIGLSIAEPALPGADGPDAHVAGAFLRRSPFQQGRFTIIDGPMAGEWRMSAIPFFDPDSGRFRGFRGEARRPHLHEVPTSSNDGRSLALGGLSADSIRQLVHELRTPLNAILGFAEIIEQQLFGPAGRKM